MRTGVAWYDASCVARSHRRGVATARTPVGLLHRRLLKLWLPVSSNQALAYTVNIITAAQVGHLGSLQLSAMGLASTMYHITGLSMCVTSNGNCLGWMHLTTGD